MVSKIQSIVFDKDKYTLKEAVDWLKRYHFKGLSVDEKDNTYRFRQMDPNLFKRMRYKRLKDGIKAVLGVE